MEQQPSRTALGTAYLRAAHQLLDGKPLVLEDDVVLRLLGVQARTRILSDVDRYQTPAARALRSHVVLRSRFAEDRLASAVGRGVTQYVILGAGFDTFVLRQPSWAASLRLFELDHPATQGEKRSRLLEAGLVLPENCSLVAIDFEEESLLDCCRRSGVSLLQPTLFAWLGVSMYLEQADVESALRSMAMFASGSEVVLTFLQPPAIGSTPGSSAASVLAERVARLGEPFRCYFEPHALADACRASGFSMVEFLVPEEARDRYFRGRPPDLPAPGRTGIACALV